jgi:hypothetical protein
MSVKISKITKYNGQDIVTEARAEMLAVAKKYGLTVKVGPRWTYSHDGSLLRFKVEFNTPKDSATVEYESKMNQMAYGVKVGTTFRTYEGTLYIVTGFAPRNRKYPVLVMRKDGKKFKVSLATVKNGTIISKGE